MDVIVIIQLVPAVESYVSRAVQFDRVLDIPVMPTVQIWNKVVDMVLYDSCPWFGQSSCVHQQGRRHPLIRTVEVPQIQSSTELNVDLEAGLAHFFGLLREGLSPWSARIFRAFDDEEFFVIEGSPGWRGRQESDSQVTCHM